MPLNKLDNFIKNTEGRILYVSPSDLDSTDAISNQGNSLAQPFKTLQRALLEAARFSYVKGASNDFVERTTILLMPGEHIIDNRPGFQVYDDSGVAKAKSPSGTVTNASDTLNLLIDSVFDLTQENNILYKFNSIHGGVIVPRGTSIVGLDLRKTKLRPKYVPNPTDSNTPNSSIFRITGACYFWQFSMFDGDSVVYTNQSDFSTNNRSAPTFSHHKLTCFEYADGVNNVTGQTLTDLDMYYAKLSNSFNTGSGRDIDDKFPADPDAFAKMRPEWEIVGAFASDPINISTIEAGSGGTPTSQVTVKTSVNHGLSAGTPIKLKGVSPNEYNISTTVQSISPTNPKEFTYLLPSFPANLTTPGNASNATVTIETDTVSGASPYIFNVSLRSVFGMNGMHADGSKASGFKSMVVAQFTGISLQKDDRAFVKYNKTSRIYEGIAISKQAGATLSTRSSSTDAATVYHLDSEAIYRSGWEQIHVKASNDAILQIVSVFAIGYNSQFAMLSGADASITNSNSNFGQLALVGDGFKAEAFDKDNRAFITSLITPKAIQATQQNVDWVRIDAGVTTSVGISSHLYLLGFKDENVLPSVITQGFRIGAQYDGGTMQGVGIGSERLFMNLGDITGYGTSEAQIVMPTDKITSGRRNYNVNSGPTSNELTIGAHDIQTGEKILIRTKSGDLPENVEPNTVYYAIRSASNKIKIAATLNEANAMEALTIHGGSEMVIITRVTDKMPGDIGHPVQYDSTNSQWYIQSTVNNQIFTALNQLGVSGLKDNPATSFVKRVADTRSIDEKLYKIRIVVPKEIANAKTPENGFVIQQSSSTGATANTDFTKTSLTTSDYEFEKNPCFIAKVTRSSNTVTVIAEQPHRLNVGDAIIIRNVTDSTNTAGTFNLGYNGNFTVASVADDMTFTYTTATTPGSPATNDVTVRSTSLPRFERRNLQTNLYIYRNEVISEYIDGVQDGIYHAIVLNADNPITEEFTDLEYSQNVVNLYPNLDRDNALVNSNSPASVSFAKRAPLGEVVTNDVQASITRETVDRTLKTLYIGHDVSSVTNNPTNATITFARNHGLGGINTFTGFIDGGSGHTNGTYNNVKLFNESGLTTWQGATANITVVGGAVTTCDIVSHGSGYSAGDFFFDTADMGGTANAKINVNAAGISTNIGDVIQFTGQTSFEGNDQLHRITGVPGANQVSIAKTAGDTAVATNQYGFVVGNSVTINSVTALDSATGLVTVTTNRPHTLFSGNGFQLNDSTNNNLGQYLVNDRVGILTFSAKTNKAISAVNGFVLKRGMDVNLADTNVESENLAVRSVPFYANESLEIVAFTSDTQIRVTSPAGVSAILKRFPMGCYVQVGSEIMRVVSSSLGGLNNDELTVIRGSMGTDQVTHAVGSKITKIQPFAVEFRRPSYVRASGHTFEYLGYGPGNYSTALPQVQTITLTEREQFLNQAQERRCGIVVYTGMNSSGDFFIGNQKKSSATGEETNFDTPNPGDEGGNNDGGNNIFNEIIVKNRIIVEGGDNNTEISEFNGPVNFNEKVTINNELALNGPLRISDPTQSTSCTTGAVTVVGGVGIGKNLNVCGNTNIGGDLVVEGTITINPGTGGATFGNLQLAVTDDNTLDIKPGQGDLRLGAGGIGTNVVAIQTNTTIVGVLSVTDDITAFWSSDSRLKDNVLPIEDALAKVISISGNTFDWNDKSSKSGHDVGLIAQEIQEVLPEAVIERDNGYLAVDYHKVIPLLVQSIKELSARIETLENNINN